LISYVNPTIDLMSMQAFRKHSVRKSLDGSRFSHFLPLYFGETEKYEVTSEHYDDEKEELVA
jgi:hypothetical protein